MHKYLIKKKTEYKATFGLIKKTFIGLSTNLFNGFNHTKCVSLSNRKWMTQSTH